MKILLLSTPVIIASLWGLVAEDAAPPCKPATAEHEWLLKLKGEWDATIEARLGPDTEPVRAKRKESVRSIGELWVLAESSGENNGTSMTSVFTLGYDAANKRFVGTWVDSMQSHLWTYTGQLDGSKTVLTLEAEGPSSVSPKMLSKYREVITLKGPEHRVIVSSIQLPDGQWVEYVTADYRRKKAARDQG